MEPMEAREEESDDLRARRSAKFSSGVLIIIIFNQIVNFGESLKTSITGLFIFNKLKITPTEVLTLTTIFGTIEHLLTPLGGVIADVVRNKFVILSIAYFVYFVDNGIYILLTITYFFPWQFAIILVFLSIQSLCYAVSNPVGEAFLMDQFKYSEKNQMLRKYLHVSRISSHVLNIIGYLLSPILKARISCLNEQDCYLVPFALFVVLYAIAQILFYAGRKFYVIKQPEIDLVVNIAPCIWHGFVHYLRERRSNPQPHWLDHARPKYDAEQVEQSKAFLRVQLMRIGLPLFIAISHNFAMSSFIVRIRTRKRIGSYKMIPDHLNLLALVISVIVWIFMAKIGEHLIKKTKLDRPLRRLFVGLCLDIIVVILYGLLAWRILQHLPVKPGGNEAQLRIFNSANCSCIIETTKNLNKPLEIVAQGTFTNKHISVHNYKAYQIAVTGSCFKPFSGNTYLQEGEAISVFIKAANAKVEISTYTEIISNANEQCLPRVSVTGADPVDKIVLADRKGTEMYMFPAVEIKGGLKMFSGGPRTVEVLANQYILYKNDREVVIFNTDLGGIYNIMITDDSATVLVIAEPNSIYFSWLIPIQIVQSFSGYFISIGTKEFDFPETPPGLRGISSAFGEIFSGFGYLLIPLFITELRMDFEFYYYALWKIALLVIFLICAVSIRSRHSNRKLI